MSGWSPTTRRPSSPRSRSASLPSITVDTFPGVVVTGHVDSIAPASGSQFSLLPPDNATGNFTKVVQRIPVKIVLDPRPSAGRPAAARHVGDRHDPHRQAGGRHDRRTGGRPQRRCRGRLPIRCSASPPSLVGAFISTLNTRVTTVGLADIRGGLSLGFDEASWLSTVFGAAQMVVCLSAAWFSIVLGPRRILLWSSAIFLISSILPPLTRDPSHADWRFRSCAASPSAPSSRRPSASSCASLPPRWWIWGLAAYAFRFVFSQNIVVLDRGLLCRERAVGVDLLAEHPAHAPDDRADLLGHAARTARSRRAPPRRLGGHHLRRRRLWR